MNDKKVDKIDTSSEDKILISFYVFHDTLERLDDLLFYMKKQLPIEKRRKLTKSIFYETGFKILIDEYNEKGKESRLWKAVQNLLN